MEKKSRTRKVQEEPEVAVPESTHPGSETVMDTLETVNPALYSPEVSESTEQPFNYDR